MKRKTLSICYVIDMFPPCFMGGGQRRIIEISNRLVDKGHKITILTMKCHSKNYLLDLDKRVKVISLGKIVKNPPKRNILNYYSFLLSAFKWIKRNRPDVVDLQPFSPLLLIPFIKLFGPKKVFLITTIHDITSKEDLSDQWASSPKLHFFIEKVLYKFPSDKILTVSYSMRNKIVDVLKIDSSKIEVIFNGVDFKAIKKISDQVSKKDQNTLIFVGRLVKHKHVDDLIKALKLLKKDFPDIKLKIIGTGPEESNLKNLVSKLNLEKNVIFLGKLKNYWDVIKEIKSSYILVLPSTREGFGLVLVEAGACGVPVIVYNTEGVVDVVSNGVNGLIIPKRNIASLANSIKLLLSNKKLYNKLSKNSILKVKNTFDWDKIINKLESFYLENVKTI